MDQLDKSHNLGSLEVLKAAYSEAEAQIGLKRILENLVVFSLVVSVPLFATLLIGRTRPVPLHVWQSSIRFERLDRSQQTAFVDSARLSSETVLLFARKVVELWNQGDGSYSKAIAQPPEQDR